MKTKLITPEFKEYKKRIIRKMRSDQSADCVFIDRRAHV